ncbi:hypothetical protein HK405_011296, partial [Cladochytrium tenue]
FRGPAAAAIETLGWALRVAGAAALLRAYEARRPSEMAVEAFLEKLASGSGVQHNAPAHHVSAPSSYSWTLLIEALTVMAVPWNVRQINDVTYATDSELEEAGRHLTRFMQLDVIRKASGFRGRPIFMYIHGGAWKFGDKRAPVYPICYHFAAKENWVVINVKCRMSDHADLHSMVLDLKRAIRWIRQNQAIHGGDPAFLAISGGSAGGHLAALLYLTQNDPHFQPGFESVDTSVQAFVPIYGALHPLGESSWRTGFAPIFLRDVVRADVAADAVDSRAGRPAEVWTDPISLARALPAETRARLAPVFAVQLSPKTTNGAPSALLKAKTHETASGWRAREWDSLVPLAWSTEFLDALTKDVNAPPPTQLLRVPHAHHGFDTFTSPRTLYACWAVGEALQAAHAAHTAHAATSEADRR